MDQIVCKHTLVTRSRGCPALCDFCDEKDVFQGYRKANDKRVLNEILDFKEKYGIHGFKWTDSTFTVNETDTLFTCNMLREHGIGDSLQWIAYARIAEVKKFKNSTLKAMKEAGCSMLHFGFETFDGTILCDVKKGFNDISIANDVISKVKDSGIQITGSFINGLPNQGEYALWKSVEIGINMDIDVYNIHSAVPPIKYAMRKDKQINSNFRIWNNDPNIPPNLFCEYSIWHFETFGMHDTLGRHTTSKEFLSGIEPTVNESAYTLEYSSETLIKSLKYFMEDGRESIEYMKLL